MKQGALERKGGRYELTEQGEELLGASEQYPTFRFDFKITGRDFNRLREAIRRGLPPGPEEESPAETQAPVLPETTAPMPQVTLSQDGETQRAVSGTLTAGVVIELAEHLRNEKYLRSGVVPIWELRRLVASRLGDEAASHRVFDPLLKQLRRQDRIRLVAIGDPSQATKEQLDDSIPGEGETFVYLEVAHEHATA